MMVGAEQTVELAGALYLASKVLGPTLAQIGDELGGLYAAGRDKIFAKAGGKIKDIEDGKRANLRVVRDVLWNGSFSESEVCAEYFGGILASSRSDDGRCDDAIQFVDVIKALSSRQLHLHYVIYNCLNKIWCKTGTCINAALGSDVQRQQVWFSSLELVNDLKLGVDTDLNVLLKESLISQYETKQHVHGAKSLPYATATASTFGVLLYACAHNRFEEWREIDHTDFGDFDTIQLPRMYASSLKDLSEIPGLVPADPAK